MYSVLKKSPKENHGILKEVRNTGLEMNEPLCLSVSKSFGEVLWVRRAVGFVTF